MIKIPLYGVYFFALIFWRTPMDGLIPSEREAVESIRLS